MLRLALIEQNAPPRPDWYRGALVDGKDPLDLCHDQISAFMNTGQDALDREDQAS